MITIAHSLQSRENMRWKSGRRSRNVEDRRRMTPKKAVGGGIGVIVIALVAMFLGVNPSTLLQMLNQGTPSTSRSTSQTSQAPRSAAEDELADMVSVVLADTEDVWHSLFQQMEQSYQEPKLVLFTGAVNSACGFTQATVGPFYCPADQKVYIDLSFYQDLRERFKAPGDFAQAYVIAHEVGHHVQNLWGISGKVHELKRQTSKVEANKLSVRLELQADCLAGVWANHAHKARNIIEKGDVKEALTAASSIGDDRIQKRTRGHVVPDSFTHGSSDQRVRWFSQGIQTGNVNDCNTFK